MGGVVGAVKDVAGAASGGATEAAGAVAGGHKKKHHHHKQNALGAAQNVVGGVLNGAGAPGV